MASVSQVLLDAYAEDDFSLDHLMAFTVSDDHARQQQVYNALKARPYGIQPHEICRMLTEGAVPADDRRVKFIGIDAYAAAGGVKAKWPKKPNGLSNTSWLPEPLRLNEQPINHTIDNSDPTADTSIPDWLDDADEDTDDLDEETD